VRSSAARGGSAHAWTTTPTRARSPARHDVATIGWPCCVPRRTGPEPSMKANSAPEVRSTPARRDRSSVLAVPTVPPVRQAGRTGRSAVSSSASVSVSATECPASASNRADPLITPATTLARSRVIERDRAQGTCIAANVVSSHRPTYRVGRHHPGVTTRSSRASPRPATTGPRPRPRRARRRPSRSAVR